MILQSMNNPISMKTTLLLLLLLGLGHVALAQPLKARIKLDPERQTGAIDPNIYGNFAEHLGRCIYGGIYDPASAQADANGFRKDVAEATRNLGVSVLRYPGGNFVSGYHWQDGIGPKNARPVRRDLAWFDLEPNQVGTDEFVQYARLVGAEPYLCINAGTGTIEEAYHWVEYCNGTGTYFADLRAKNGHPQPFKVKYWGLGNEIDGEWQIGHKNADDYGKFALEAAKLMKWADKDIKLIASGSSDWNRGKWADWNRTVLAYLHHHIDYLSLHYYTGNRDRDHYKFMATLLDLESKIKITEQMIEETRQKYQVKQPIYIALDEWNVWYRAGNETKLEEKYNLQDALVVASYLNLVVRNAHTVKMANLAQLVNVIAPMFVTQDKLWLQTTYFPIQLFAQNCRGNALSVFTDCPGFSTGEHKNVPYLDVSAAYDPATKMLVVSVVNRHHEQAISTQLELQSGLPTGKVQVLEVNSPNLADENSEKEQKVKTVEKTATISGREWSHTFPAHSFTMLKVQLK